METEQTSSSNQAEPNTVAELVHELIQLDPLANIEYLIHILDVLWFDMPLANALVSAIASRPELKDHHIVRIVQRRDDSGPITTVCDLLPNLQPSINAIRFVFAHAHESRKCLASIIAEHPDATYSDLIGAHTCTDLEDGCREKLEARIDAIRVSAASTLVRRIEKRYSESGYRTN